MKYDYAIVVRDCGWRRYGVVSRRVEPSSVGGLGWSELRREFFTRAGAERWKARAERSYARTKALNAWRAA